MNSFDIYVKCVTLISSDRNPNEISYRIKDFYLKACKTCPFLTQQNISIALAIANSISNRITEISEHRLFLLYNYTVTLLLLFFYLLDGVMVVCFECGRSLV